MGFFGSIKYRLSHRAQRAKLGRLGEGSKIVNPTILHGAERMFIGERVSIRDFARLEATDRDGVKGEVHIGDGTTAEMYLHLGAAQKIVIGNDVLIAGRVYITDHDHAWPPGSADDDGSLHAKPVTIGDRCWLGEGCVILKGVMLGECCVVGANAVVTKSFPAGSMVAGVPAKVIKQYDFEKKVWVAPQQHAARA